MHALYEIKNINPKFSSQGKKNFIIALFYIYMS